MCSFTFVNTCVEKISINKINKNDKTILLLRTDLIGDYLVTRVFLELIRKSKKFKDYKTVVLLNSAVKDLALEFDSKYADEFIFYDIRYSSPKTIKFLGESLSKYNFEYLINYHTLRHILPDEIAGAIKAKNKFALSNFALNLPDEKKDFYNKNYTKIFTASPDYFFGSVQFANLVTGENYSEHSVTSCFGINETNFPKDKKLNLNYPYVILFPSASNVQKRMGFVQDVCADLETGNITSIIVPGGNNKIMSMFSSGNDIEIPWQNIKCIGEDTILVEI